MEECLSALQPMGEKWYFFAIFRMLSSDPDNEYNMIDSTIVRAHQHSAGAAKAAARKPLVGRAVD